MLNAQPNAWSQDRQRG